MLDSPRLGVKAIGCVVSNEFRGRLQAQRGQAQAAHAEAGGASGSDTAHPFVDGRIETHKLTRHYVRWAFPGRSSHESEDLAGIPRPRLSASHTPAVRTHVWPQL